ncbi:MAG: DUF4286 family protein [Bacteroidota bacterium]
MIIYNVTVNVDHSIATAWLLWLQQEHIPDITGTGCFTHATVLRLLDVEDDEGVTYAVQYHTDNKARYEQYMKYFADTMRKKATEKWGSKFIAFRSVMELVH